MKTAATRARSICACVGGGCPRCLAIAAEIRAYGAEVRAEQMEVDRVYWEQKVSDLEVALQHARDRLRERPKRSWAQPRVRPASEPQE